MAKNNSTSSNKESRLSIRVDPERKAVIARAAKQHGHTISDFVLENAYQMATELLADEGLKPWTVREVWMAAGLTPNHYVDVTDTFGRKIAALRAHHSQTGQMEGLEDFLRGWLARNAEQAGWPEGRLAEAFQVMETG